MRKRKKRQAHIIQLSKKEVVRLYRTEYGSKLTHLACRHLDDAEKSAKSWRELFNKLKAGAGESRSKALAFEMFGVFLRTCVKAGIL